MRGRLVFSAFLALAVPSALAQDEQSQGGPIADQGPGDSDDQGNYEGGQQGDMPSMPGQAPYDSGMDGNPGQGMQNMQMPPGGMQNMPANMRGMQRPPDSNVGQPGDPLYRAPGLTPQNMPGGGAPMDGGDQGGDQGQGMQGGDEQGMQPGGMPQQGYMGAPGGGRRGSARPAKAEKPVISISKVEDEPEPDPETPEPKKVAPKPAPAPKKTAAAPKAVKAGAKPRKLDLPAEAPAPPAPAIPITPVSPVNP